MVGSICENGRFRAGNESVLRRECAALTETESGSLCRSTVAARPVTLSARYVRL